MLFFSKQHRLISKSVDCLYLKIFGSRELISYGSGLGFDNSVKRNKEGMERAIIEKAVEKVFTPEFLHRLDEQILFNTL